MSDTFLNNNIFDVIECGALQVNTYTNLDYQESKNESSSSHHGADGI